MELGKEHRLYQPPAGHYCNGKKCPTLSHETDSLQVQVRGRRGQGSKKTVSTTKVKSVLTEHFTCVSQAGGGYLTHVTPITGTGRDIAQELVALVRERNINLVVMGIDGTAVHNGVIRVMEQKLEETVQHIICLLHLKELPFRHEFIAVDCTTSGHDAFNGKIVKNVAKDVWIEDIVSFPTVKGKSQHYLKSN